MFASVKNWWDKPFDANMDAARWAAFLLFVIIVCAAWRSVLLIIKEAAQ